MCIFYTEVLKKALHEFITERYLQSTEMTDNKVCGFGITGYLEITILFIALRLCTNPHPLYLVSLLARLKNYRSFYINYVSF